MLFLVKEGFGIFNILSHAIAENRYTKDQLYILARDLFIADLAKKSYFSLKTINSVKQSLTPYLSSSSYGLVHTT